MELERVAPIAGLAGCLATVLTFVAPYVLTPGWTAELGRYYAAGPFGASGVAFFALVGGVVFLAGLKGRTESDTAAGVALVLSLAMVALALSWALSVSLSVIYGYPESWIVDHRWILVGATGLVAVSAVSYARTVV